MTGNTVEILLVKDSPPAYAMLALHAPHQQGLARAIPALGFLTSSRSEKNTAESRERGVNSHIVKPVKAQLTSAVQHPGFRGIFPRMPVPGT